MPDLPGLLLLQPKVASQSNVVRKKSFLNDEEISQIQTMAAKLNSINPVPSWDTIYLQTDSHFRNNLPRIYSKIKQLVIDTDRKNFGLLYALDKSLGLDDGVNARCVEFHEYGEHARRICGPHIDTGSIFTVDIMLSSTDNFDGGIFVTDSKKQRIIKQQQGSNDDNDDTSSNNNETTEQQQIPHDHREVFEKGDAIVFPSHKRHSVTPIISGTRCVLVLEFWEGSECQKSHRCMNPCCGWEYDLNTIY